MDIKELNKSEKAWIKRAQKLFNDAPDRFAFVTIGDPYFAIVDAAAAEVTELYDGGAERAGIVLGDITLKQSMHGVSG